MLWVLELLGIGLAVLALVVLIASRRRVLAPSTGRSTLTSDVDRRSFLARSLVLAMAMLGVAVGGSWLAFVWPQRPSGFGSRIRAGTVDDLRRELEATGRPVYNQDGKFYIVAHEPSQARDPYVEAGVASSGLMALYQKCSHLGCRVPFCPTSGFFECPCHGGLFNAAGEAVGGPVPAGMWRFAIEVEPDGSVLVDTSRPIAQPPRGTFTRSRHPRGEHCVEL